MSTAQPPESSRTPAHQGEPAPVRQRWLITAATLAAAVLAGVFMLYAQPDFMVQMANQLWSCF